jgi:hypothetical protein
VARILKTPRLRCFSRPSTVAAMSPKSIPQVCTRLYIVIDIPLDVMDGLWLNIGLAAAAEEDMSGGVFISAPDAELRDILHRVSVWIYSLFVGHPELLFTVIFSDNVSC